MCVTLLLCTEVSGRSKSLVFSPELAQDDNISAPKISDILVVHASK